MMFAVVRTANYTCWSTVCALVGVLASLQFRSRDQSCHSCIATDGTSRVSVKRSAATVQALEASARSTAFVALSAVPKFRMLISYLWKVTIQTKAGATGDVSGLATSFAPRVDRRS
jgi:hypothetical protein